MKKLPLHDQPFVATDSTRRRAMSRRAFVQQWLLVGGLAATGRFGVACGQADMDAEASPQIDPHHLPSLGGAPDSHQGVTVAAFVDTIIPGKHRDPEGAPGAIDVGAAGLFFDPSLPAAPFVGVLVLVLDATAKRMFGNRSFSRLGPAEREEVVGQCIEDTDVVVFAVQLAKLAYFASDQAAEHLGYPGANSGYVNDPDFGFGAALTQELTLDGNWP